jgi:hypothetical protein
MSQQTNQPKQPETIGRRELLKALAATTGAVTAASMLPGKWARPVVEVGLLPAHAQQTGYTIVARIVPTNPGIQGGEDNGSRNPAFIEVEVTVTPNEAGIQVRDNVNVEVVPAGAPNTQNNRC